MLPIQRGKIIDGKNNIKSHFIRPCHLYIIFPFHFCKTGIKRGLQCVLRNFWNVYLHLKLLKLKYSLWTSQIFLRFH